MSIISSFKNNFKPLPFLLQQISINKLTELNSEKLVVKIENYLKKLNTKRNDVLLSRSEVALYFQVSLPNLSMDE